eukprot:5943395-Pyramimonas_sp.AAC.1
MPRGPLARVGRASASKPAQNPHRRRMIVIGVVGMAAVAAIASVVVIIATSIATIIIVSAVIDVAMIPRPPESPTRTEVPARQRGPRDAPR